MKVETEIADFSDPPLKVNLRPGVILYLGYTEAAAFSCRNLNLNHLHPVAESTSTILSYMHFTGVFPLC